MKRFAVLVGSAAALVLVFGGSAFASGVDDKSPEQKLRKDVAKQVTKYTQCLTKATSKCEKNGANSGVECHLDTGAVDYAGDSTLDPKNKQPAAFQADIAKCDSKLNFAKKGSGDPVADYQAIGCPGDCADTVLGDDPGGTQRCADLTAFQTNVKSTAPDSAKSTLGLLATLLDGACGADTGKPNTDPARQECNSNNAKALGKYSKGLFKCQEKCENDYKGKKGGGGDNDRPLCIVGAVGASAEITECEAAVKAKAGTITPFVTTLVLPQIVSAVNDVTDGFYNKDNPLTTENEAGDDDVCSTCGNNDQEGIEECDGTDDGLCSGACTANCTCPSVCGNGVQQAGEECDGADDLACPGLCAACNCL